MQGSVIQQGLEAATVPAVSLNDFIHSGWKLVGEAEPTFHTYILSKSSKNLSSCLELRPTKVFFVLFFCLFLGKGCIFYYGHCLEFQARGHDEKQTDF